MTGDLHHFPEHPSRLSPERLLQECELVHTKRSGPGGQHRNKVSTAVVLTHIPSSIRAEASERRSQKENQKIALFRLRLKLAIEIRCMEAPSTLSPLWRSRIARGRIQISSDHDDFPSLLSEALDRMELAGGVAVEAAKQLELTTSQLLKLIASHPPAWEWLKKTREHRGLPPLHIP